LVQLLQSKGYTPGIITRGYKSQGEGTITLLDKGEQNDIVGDESNMLSAFCQCPIGVGVNRPDVAKNLIETKGVNIIVCDDGLQHLELGRDIEIVVKRDLALGNGWCLPAGPLREPLSRLSSVDLLVDRDSNDVSETLGDTWALEDEKLLKPLADFKKNTVHAIAGIGFPQVFFDSLKLQGLTLIEHHYSDHYDYVASDLDFNDGLAILMTHKDAIKIQSFNLKNCWVVPLQLELSAAIQDQFLTLLQEKTNG